MPGSDEYDLNTQHRERMSHIATLNSFNRFIVSFISLTIGITMMIKCMRYDNGGLHSLTLSRSLSRSMLDMLSCSVEVIQEPAIAVAAVVAVGHKRRQNELPALAPLLVSHLVVVVGLHCHEVVDHPGHLLHIVLLVKHAVVKDGKDLSPPRLLDIVLDDVHHLQSVLLVIK